MLGIYILVSRSSHMDLGPRQAAFVKEEMKRVERDTSRNPTARVEAERIRERVETEITE